MTPEERGELEAILGHHFQRPEELDRALTHRSHRQSSNGTDNERLEFLGDRVLGLIASERLCRTFPDWNSGQLSKGLARVVSATSLHAAAKRLKLGHYLRLGPGKKRPAAAIRKGCWPTLTKQFSARFIWIPGLPRRLRFCSARCSIRRSPGKRKDWNAPTTNRPSRNGCSGARAVPWNTAYATSPGPNTKRSSKWRCGTRVNGYLHR